MFECKKILNGRGNVPEPEVKFAGANVSAGQALTLAGGSLVAAGEAAAPTHIALADATIGQKVACYAVLPGMIFDVPVSAAPTSLAEGAKLKLATDGLSVTATAGGAATVVNLNGAAKAGDIIQVKF